MSETFGRYVVMRMLGRGAMGVVYLATDPMLNRQVAVKTVDLAVDDPLEREFLRNRLLRDARAAAVLKHPNIVGIHDVFEDGGHAYVVMEYVEGDTLAAGLKNSCLPEAFVVLKVVRQAADALDYTHARGVIHRDIKPANIMIDSAGNTKVMDFGIARISDARTCTPTGMVMGTVEYMAPEQILGIPLDGRADQFALGVVAYQMMTGSTLFGPNSVATLTYKVVNETPPLPSMRNASLPPGVDAVLAKVLAKNPENRFATCSEFASALTGAFASRPATLLALPTESVTRAQSGQTTIGLPGTPAAIREPAKRSRARMVAAGFAVLLLIGALAGVIWQPWNRTRPAVAPIAPPSSAPVTANELLTDPKAGAKTNAKAKSKVQEMAPPATKPGDALTSPSPGPPQKAPFAVRRAPPPPPWAQITEDIRKHYGSFTTIGPLGAFSFSSTASDAADPWVESDNWKPTGAAAPGELCRQFVQLGSRQPGGAMMETMGALLYQLRSGRWEFLDIKTKPVQIQK